MVFNRANALAGIATAIAVMLTPATAHAGTGGTITSPTTGTTVRAGDLVTVSADVDNVCDAKITATTPGGTDLLIATAPYDPLCAPTPVTGKFVADTAGTVQLTLKAGKGAEIDTVALTATPAPAATPTATPTHSDTPAAQPTATVTQTVTATPSPSPSVVATTKLPSTKKATPTATPKATAKPTVTATVTATPALVYVTPPAPPVQPQAVAPQVQAPAPQPVMPEAPAAPQVAAPASTATPASNAMAMTTVGDESAMSAVGGFLTGTALPIIATAVLVYGLMLIRNQRKAAPATAAPAVDATPADADAPTTVQAPVKD